MEKVCLMEKVSPGSAARYASWQREGAYQNDDEEASQAPPEGDGGIFVFTGGNANEAPRRP